MRAVRSNNLEDVQGEIVKAQDLRVVYSRGQTALMYASSWSTSQIVEALLEHEKGMKDNKGITALMYAIRRGKLDNAAILLPYEHSICDNDRKTALMEAASKGYAEIV